MSSLLSSISSEQFNHSIDYIYISRSHPALPHEIVIENPAKALEVIQNLLARDDGDKQILEFLRNIWIYIVQTGAGDELFLECIKHLPNANLLLPLMDTDCPLFLYILSIVPSGHSYAAAELFKCLTEQEEWKKRLSNFIIKIKDDLDTPELNHSLKDFNYSFLLHLNDEHLKKFIRYFIKKKERCDCLAYLLVSFKSESVYYALKKFSQRFSFTSAQYKQLIATLSNITTYPSDFHIYAQVIKRCRKKNELGHLYFELSNFPFYTSACLIKAMRPEEKAAVFEIYNYPGYFCNILESQCFLEESYQERKELCRLALNTIVSVNDVTRQEKLKELFLELSRRRSWMSVYLLVTLPSEELIPALISLTPTELTRFFISCPPDKAMPLLYEDLFQDQYLSQLLYTGLRFDLNPISNEGEEANRSIALIEQPSTIRFFTDTNLLNIPQVYLESYLKVIQTIPPFILRIGCSIAEKFNLYLSLVHLLTDNQLLFVVMAMHPENVFNCLEAISKNLRSHQYSLIIMNLSTAQLSNYLISKIYQVQAESQNFIVELRLFSSELQEFENKPITKNKFDELFQKALMLRGRANSILNADIYTLATFMENIGVNPAFHVSLKDGFFDTITHLRRVYDTNLTSRSFLFLQLQLIERNIIAEGSADLFDSIYPEFWNSVTEGVLVHLNIQPNSPLKISHAGELPLIGISSNEDLTAIGICQSKQEFLDRLVMTLNRIKNGDGNIQFELSEKWRKFFNIALTEPELQNALNELVNYFEIENVDPRLLRTTLIRICDELFTLDDLQGIVREELVDAKSILTGLRIPVSFAKKLIAKLARIIRQRQTLSILQHYLKQPRLRKCWEILQRKDIKTLEALKRIGNMDSQSLFKIRSRSDLLS